MHVIAVLRQVFANPDMRRVQGGWLLAIAAEWIYIVNLLVLAYVVGGVLGAGLVGMLRTLPAAVVGPMLALSRTASRVTGCCWQCTACAVWLCCSSRWPRWPTSRRSSSSARHCSRVALRHYIAPRRCR